MFIDNLLTERSIANRINGAAVALDHRFHIFRPAGTAFDFEHSHAGTQHAVQERQGAKVFGRHNVFVVDEQLLTGLAVGDFVAAAARLETLSAIG